MIECSWDELCNDVKRAGSLDDVIRGHNKFLHSVTERALLSPSSQQMLSQLRSIFDCIQKFRHTQVRFHLNEYVSSKRLAQDLIFGEGAKELSRRNRFAADVARRAQQDEWGLTEEHSEEQQRLVTDFATRAVPEMAAKLKVVSESYEVGDLRCYAIPKKCLQAMVAKFLVMLTQHPDPNLRFLSFRVDFNEHYRR